MRCFAFHLMPYIGLDPSYEGPAWVTVPNSLYDPVVGSQLYNRYLDELVSAEALGFDGVCVNEHHQNAYGNMPSPNLIASILARQTSKVKIAVVGNALPLYDPPTRVAEEFAMIDVISGGRLIAGMVVGGGPEYYSFSVNPSYARERFREAHDLIKKAWTEPGPFEWVGKHFRIRYVNPWPRPIQQPHPEIWIPGAGSLETFEFVARNRYSYMGIPYFRFDVFERYFSMFRDACEAEGYTADPLQAGWLVPIYVAETDEQARREYEEHLWYFVKRLLPGITIQPPGYTSARSLASILKASGLFMLNVETWEEIIEGRYAIVGSPETVADTLIDSLGRLGTGNLLGLFQLGSLPHDLTAKNMQLFADKVLPRLRTEFPEGRARLPAGREGGLMPEFVEELVDAPIGKIQVWRAGAGPQLVYLHSAGGEHVHPALEQLAESFEVIVPVFPGFEESEGLDEIDSMEDAIFHLLDLWGILGLDAPEVLGLSLGGWLALELATRYPDRVSKMVLVNPVGIYLPEAPMAEMFGRTPGELADMLFADQSYPVAAAMHAMDAFAGDVGKETEIPLEFVLPMWKALGATARLGWDPYLHNPKLRGRLRRITAPTLIVAGAQDGLVPLVYAETFAAEVPGARLEVIEGAAHWLPFEKPDELTALVRSFLSS